MVSWFIDQFERKWNNTGASSMKRSRSCRCRPTRRRRRRPRLAPAACRPPASCSKWFGGPWAHLYDVYLGTTSESGDDAQLRRQPRPNSRPRRATSAFSYALPHGAQPGHHVLLESRRQDHGDEGRSPARCWTFTTAGAPPPPPPIGGDEIVLYASEAPLKVGSWSPVSDSSAAGGARLQNANVPAAKVTTASANPAHYFEMTFDAEASRPYRLWIRGKAISNNWGNDSVFVQFSGSLTAAGVAHLAHRVDVGHRVQPRRVQRLRPVELGLAGQRVGRRRDGYARLLHRPVRRRSASRSARTASASTRSSSRPRRSSTPRPAGRRTTRRFCRKVTSRRGTRGLDQGPESSESQLPVPSPESRIPSPVSVLP